MRQIAHLDLDAFYASVEVLQNPELAGKPMVVGNGSPAGRGVVTTASYEARKFGVHSAMPLRQAMRLCPPLVIVPMRHHLYAEYSQKVMDLLRQFSPDVEQVSIDEAYIGLYPRGMAEDIAREMQKRIKADLSLDCTIGLASNKLVAKIACNTVKPRGFIVVPFGAEETFLAPLAIERLPGAGPATRAKLARWNVKTIGDLRRIPAEELRGAFGKHGLYLHEAAFGRDDSPIVTEWKTKSISQENTFETDVRNGRVIEQELADMCERVARELAEESLLARTVVLKLRYADFATITRQTTLRVPKADAATIRDCVVKLFHSNWNRRPVRLVGVGVHNLIEETESWQMGMDLGS